MKNLLVSIIAILLLCSCGDDANISKNNLCSNSIISKHFSPNNSLNAILYQFDCGAMTSFSTQISILSSIDKLNVQVGNVFSAKHGNYRGDWGGPYAEVQWINDEKLLIRYAEDTTILQKQTQIGRVKIEYETLPVVVSDEQKVQESEMKEFFKKEGIDNQ